MDDVIFFDLIRIAPPKDRIYQRLGYRQGVTSLTETQQGEIERYINDALELIELKGAGIRIPITIRAGAHIDLSQEISFTSVNLAKMLNGCREIVIMGATAGVKIIEAIADDSQNTNLTRGVVLDAVASEMVDGALGWIMDYFDQWVRRENKRLLPKRFSPGYGDFTIENQKAIFTLLNLSHFGVSITGDCILVPEKSVTAVTGII